jgi:hypothetical protein
VIIFEAAFLYEGYIIRTDILIKNGNDIELIEVKSKSYNPYDAKDRRIADEKYFLSKDLKPYTEDVAYQYMVLKQALPNATIKAFLMMPDKLKTAEQDGLLNLFVLKYKKSSDKKRKETAVSYLGTEEDTQALIKNNILAKVDVTDIVIGLQSDITHKAAIYLKSVIDDVKIKPALNYTCKACEYRVNETAQKNGFNECWGKLAHTKPHILDLGQLGNINKREQIINELIAQQKTAMSDVPLEYLFPKEEEDFPSRKKSKTSEPKSRMPIYNGRPYYQLFKKNEFLIDEIYNELALVNYPIHFIDFETSQMALPFHKGMTPYQNVLFQFSVHTIATKGAEPTHKEWINTQDQYPNIECAKQLRMCLGDEGTIMVWSAYENTQLRNVLEAIQNYYPHETDLANWLSDIIMTADTKQEYSGRLLDMHDICKKYYFHPIMGGRTSIKVALPAVLKETTSIQIKQWLINLDLLRVDAHNQIIDPYKVLPAISINDEELKDNTDTEEYTATIKDGGMAMKAYQEMLYGQSKNNKTIKQNYKQALLLYCKLDTLAMVIIWQHWADMLLENKKIVSRESLI